MEIPTTCAVTVRARARPDDGRRRLRSPPELSLRLRRGTGSLDQVHQLTQLVNDHNACALPGCTIKYDSFMRVMWRAVARGYVEHRHAAFVARGLRYGFTAGVQKSELHGQRIFKNYKSAVEAMEQVGRATQKRIDAGKTICIGEWSRVHERLRTDVKDFYVCPLGAVPKPLEPTEVRPASDHTRTGLNASTCMDELKHALTANADVAWLLKQNYFMYVTDVEAAFPLLPLAPWLWWFMLFRVCLPGDARRSMLCMHRNMSLVSYCSYLCLFVAGGVSYLIRRFYYMVSKV